MSRDAYMGIDQSYSGFAVSFWMPHDQQHLTRCQSFPKSKYGDGVERLLYISGWLEQVIDDFEHDFDSKILGAAMEGYSMGAKNGREQAGELGAVVKIALREFDLLIVPPTSLKKFVTGRGNAKKNEMLLAVFKKWGFEFDDDNEADAFSLARVAEAADRGAATKYEAEVLAKLGVSADT